MPKKQDQNTKTSTVPKLEVNQAVIDWSKELQQIVLYSNARSSTKFRETLEQILQHIYNIGYLKAQEAYEEIPNRPLNNI
jgi:hypothetical protein